MEDELIVAGIVGLFLTLVFFILVFLWELFR